jgi:diamine N-acetyltransferase
MITTAINIRRATSDYAAELSTFAGKTFAFNFGYLYPPEVTAKFLETDYSEDIYKGWILDTKYGVWVATTCRSDAISKDERDVIVGYCVCGPSTLPRTESGSAEMKKLYIDKACYGNGLANKLFETGVSWMRESYAGHPIYLSVYSENFRAIKFYNRYNFVQYDEHMYVVGGYQDKNFILRESDSPSETTCIERNLADNKPML